MITTIENDFLEVKTSQKGAELYSIKSKKTGVEYLWQGDPEFWTDRSPVLFPICGRLFGGKYYYNGVEYKMDIHGFSRLLDFEVNKISNKTAEFTLKSNLQTKKSYPFDFEFSLIYKLKNNALITEYRVKNLDDKELIFSYGAHPGFRVPQKNNEKFEDYYLEFSKSKLKKLVFSSTCFDLEKLEDLSLSENKLFLRHELFDNDAIFIQTKTDAVKLKSIKNNSCVEVSYKDMTTLGLWHAPKTNAPYICIEPWHGLPSTDGVVDDLKTKKQMIKLEKNKTYENFYTIKIIEN